MTWELAAWGLLALVIGGGFTWYERSRPPARMVALVAALAALAVAGRLAFAAIPNVVATTDIVLITGYAVGAAPGFAVGALAAAISNLWLGQGPWTPWEMAGWGLVGLAGAGLATITRRRLGRVGLAVACGLAGFAYGALLDFSVMVGYGGEQSLDRYLAISARGVPFNIAHAAGNVVLALAAGPALVRMISRYRGRFEFRWREAGAASLGLLLALVLALPHAHARSSPSAASWLARAQNADGGFATDRGGTSSPAMTGWASLGLEAVGRNPLDLDRGGPSPIAYLRANVSDLRSTGDLERTVLALEGAGVNPRRFAHRDLVAELRRRRSGSGAFEKQVNLTAFGMLALHSAGASGAALHRSAAWLRRAPNGDGGWGFQARAGSDPDSTGAALQGLAAAGGGGSAIRHGASYLRHAQLGDGGFALAGASSSNTQSTAWAVQGLIAAGANPAGVRRHGHSPFDYLARRRAADGHYAYSAASDQTPVWVTGQALLAIDRKAFPLAAVPRARHATRPSKPASSPSGGGVPRSGAGAGAQPPTGFQHSNGGTSPRAGRAIKPSGRGSGSARASGAPGQLAAGRPASVPAAPAELTASRGGGGPGLAFWLAAGFGLLVVALAGGFLWYRRRLP
jgi:energy-coupling factor transport system substrate-specific component